jgi:hypothetical protein
MEYRFADHSRYFAHPRLQTDTDFRKAIKIAAPTPTRLELCWVKSGPPAGPQNVHVNFEGAYPIGLFRMFLPSPGEIASIPNGKAPNDWYVQRSMNRIWNWSGNKDVPVRVPFRYDVVGGMANFGVGAFGGSFRLKRFLDNMFYNVNCYDMAALAQLACSILLDWDGTEVLMSSWVFQQPCGYINSGQLFGWPEYPDCNNPFWGSNQQGICRCFFILLISIDISLMDFSHGSSGTGE